jgi:uncharacterized membrane protein YoaK (UPF0700 family)
LQGTGRAADEGTLAMHLRTDSPATPAGTGAALPVPMVVRLLVVLSAAAGSLDVLCVTRLGGVFASVITGNLVQLGHAVSTVDTQLAVGGSAAVGGYALGVAAGTVALRRGGTGWRPRTSLVAAAELVMLAGVVAGWRAVDAQPGRTTAPILLALAATAMGVQSAVTISSGVPGASTTYLTGTLTDAVRALTGGSHRGMPTGAAIRLAALLCGAAVGALALRVTPLWAPVLPVALVGVVVVAAALGRDRREQR